MKIAEGQQGDWDNAKANNTDAYGGAIMTLTEEWAGAMELAMAKGEALEDCAERCSHETSVEGFTAFMYGAAASQISWAWEHGEQFRRWHNLDTQIGTEGEKANEQGGTIKPALLAIETGD